MNIMKRILLSLSLAFLALTSGAQNLLSPNGLLEMQFSLDAQGRPTYALT